MSSGSIAAKGRRAGKSPWVEGLGRVGLAAKGVLYLVIGLLAIQVARPGRDEKADTQGALSEIAQKPFGRVLLIVLALGLAAHALWRLAQAVLDRDGEGKGPKGARQARRHVREGRLVRRPLLVDDHAHLRREQGHFMLPV